MICACFGLLHYSVSCSEEKGLCVIYLYNSRSQQCTPYIVITLKTLVGIKLEWTKVETIRILAYFISFYMGLGIAKKKVQLYRKVV